VLEIEGDPIGDTLSRAVLEIEGDPVGLIVNQGVMEGVNCGE
jgi:hypothetical protein